MCRMMSLGWTLPNLRLWTNPVHSTAGPDHPGIVLVAYWWGDVDVEVVVADDLD
jgi:hypothetical protein